MRKYVAFKIMKKLYILTVTGSSGRNYVLMILFYLYVSKAGLFERNLF